MTIPNTEVKPSSADGTAGAAWWESRSPPIISESEGQDYFWPSAGFDPEFDRPLAHIRRDIYSSQLRKTQHWCGPPVRRETTLVG